ncbi:TIGR03943 family protein [Seinonella peptonophila]|uniref:TIGR03943 family protein n=1 Tax=Seinonella peptonophila TaxID=112248 RepID=A0A1M4ZGQ9_9BACL|nr:TIGR03943 family protein [Seinonella peptonophila]SHF16987.1 TIGR03943 family protein [Seinonella peptonophila]
MTAWIRMLICFGMAIMLISLILLDQLPLLLHPRFHIWTYISIILFIILGWIQAIHLREKELHPVGFWGYLFVLLPLVTYLFIPPKALDASMANQKGTLVTKTSQQQKKQPIPSIETNKPSELGDPNDPNVQNLIAMLKQKEPIKLTESNFANYLSAMEMFAEKVKGKQVHLKGMAYQQDEHMILGRFVLSCCTADASMIGFVIENKNNLPIHNNRWYEVTGRLSTIKVFDFPSPLLLIEKATPTQAPKDPYVYFNY